MEITMNLDKVKAVVAKVAPAIGVAIGGPFGGIAGKMIQDALGLDNEQAVIAALQSDPNALLQLKQAELKMQEFLRDAEIREEQLAVTDRSSARDLAARLGSAAPQLSITVALTAMIGWVIYELFADAPPKGSENVLYIILGQLSTAWMAAISFFVGTTAGSGQKTKALVEAAKL